MSRHIKEKFRSFGVFLVFWFVALNLFNLVRRFGTAEIVGDIAIQRPPILEMVHLNVYLAIILALLSIITDEILSVRRTMHMSYGRVLLLSFVLNIGMLIIVVILTIPILHRIGLRDDAIDVSVFRVLFSKNVLIAAIFITIMNTLINFGRQLDSSLGKGNLLKLISGKYHSPKEEQLIFMFLDLKGSTTAAEKMGHFKYSHMIQQCYYDLTIPLQKHEASVYQYVGDEAVIYWAPKNGLREVNCLKLFFEFEKLLEERKAEYIQQFDWFPEFKAGLHIGNAIVTQVGYLKREIAFHGDTLNAASRIAGLCNSKEARVLISQDLKNQLIDLHGELSDTTFVDHGEENLKGRNEGMRIFGVHQEHPS